MMEYYVKRFNDLHIMSANKKGKIPFPNYVVKLIFIKYNKKVSIVNL